MKITLAVLVASLLMGGCANLNSIYRTFDVANGKSPMVDIRQRAILVAPNKAVTEEFDNNGQLTAKKVRENGMFVCAEPSPDAMASLAYELAAKGAIPEKASGELAFALQDSAAFTGIRTQSIQLLRDFAYRLCESHLSGAITSAQYDLLMRRYQKNTVALLAIEQLTGTVKAPPTVLTASGKAEATKSLAEQRAERERVGDQISDLEKQKESVKKKRDETKAADANADTSAMDEQLADFDGKIKRLKSDIDVIDKAITGTKGILAEGKTEVTIKTDSATQRSDEHVATVADVVRDIVNNIVLADDENQVCMSVLQSPAAKTDQRDFAEWCIKSLNNQAAAKSAYIALLQDEWQEAKTAAATGKPSEKAKAEKTIEEVKKKLEAEGRGANTYSAPFVFEK